MSSYINKGLSDLNIKITPVLAKQIDRFVLQFEIYKEHPIVLNGSFLGVNKFIFSNENKGIFFDIVNVYETDLISIIKTIPSIDTSRKVSSDPFSLLITYLIHQFINSKLPSKVKTTTLINLLKLWQYRFFSSLVNHYYKHGAKQEIMQTIIENLSFKYDIKVYGSWKKVMIARAESLLDNSNKHFTALKKYDSDKAILYVITDTQTRIRSQLKNITKLYYDLKDSNDFILSTSNTLTVDGVKILKEYTSGFGNISQHLIMKILNKSAFINPKYIDMVLFVQKSLNKGILTRTLISIADSLNIQKDEGTSLKVISKRDGSTEYQGVEILVQKLIQVIYTNVVHNTSINSNNKLEIFNATRTLRY